MLAVGAKQCLLVNYTINKTHLRVVRFDSAWTLEGLQWVSPHTGVTLSSCRLLTLRASLAKQSTRLSSRRPRSAARWSRQLSSRASRVPRTSLSYDHVLGHFHRPRTRLLVVHIPSSAFESFARPFVVARGRHIRFPCVGPTWPDERRTFWYVLCVCCKHAHLV